MICRPLPSKIDQWVAPRERLARSAGWHVSTVLVAMLKAMGTGGYDHWGKRDEPRKPTDEVGYMWEDMLSAPLAERTLVPPNAMLLPPAELEIDNIYGTPDRPLFDFERERFVNEEVKATWMSCTTVVDEALQPIDHFQHEKKFSYWRLQTKTYAAMIHQRAPLPWLSAIESVVGTPALCSLMPPKLPPLGRIRALFLNGRYKGELAVPAGWELEWTEAELTTWWANVVRFARAHPELQTEGEALL